MPSTSLLAASLALIALSAVPSPVEAYTRIVLHTLKPLVVARIDPLISPGNISQHTHIVVGASNFNDVYDPTYLRQSECTNLPVQDDKSNYWAGLVYRVQANGTYVGMRSNTRIYYEQPGTRPGVEVEPFPYNHRMIAGNPMRKTFNPNSQADLLSLYFCQNFNADGSSYGEESYSLPNKSCAILVAKTFFPTCWNGRSFNYDDPTAHMRYPNFGGGFLGANCPRGFERRFPSVLIENYYFDADQSPHSGDQQYILANGDTTGYGLHADFQNGWNQDTLKSMLTNCKTVPVEEPANEACPSAFLSSYSQEKADACTFSGDIPDEENGYQASLQYLPGCNLPWGAESGKPACDRSEFLGNPLWINIKSGLRTGLSRLGLEI